MRLIAALPIILLYGSLSFCGAEAADPVPAQANVFKAVIKSLQGSGVPESYVKSVFDDPRVTIHEDIIALIHKPAEKFTYEEYRKLLITEERIAGGAQFYADNKSLLAGVSQTYGVDPFVLVALVGIESKFGEKKGKYPVFNALYTQAELLPRRSAWAVKELAQFLKLCYFRRREPFAIYGSYAGAFGFGQFMPSSYNAYAVDFDGDAYPDHFAWPDTLASIANYFVKNGYHSRGQGFSEGSGVWKALRAYNHSDNYVRVILDLRLEIQKKLGQAG
ncbi:MAG: lytic murein transglycosylase [Elusimicrobiales bacterium]|jgi:membrane-bound lytic murein transglycosylase B